MADHAQVTSVDAIEAFRASLVVYLSKVKPAVEQVTAEVMRTRVWVQSTQRQFWENQLRLRQRKLEEAKEALFNARISQFNQSTLMETMAVQRAQKAVVEAEGKLAMLKKWSRDIESRADPLAKQIEQFHGYLLTDLPEAVALLAQFVKTLDAYAEVSSVRSSAAAPPPPAPASAAPTTGGKDLTA
jgi:hypothetical protein